jgi:hypothetical protein
MAQILFFGESFSFFVVNVHNCEKTSGEVFEDYDYIDW